MREIRQGESSNVARRVYFQLVDATDGMTAETGEAGGQPQISVNGGAFSNTGIGTLSSIGNGRYYAELTTGALAAVGDIIETRYKSGNTAECPGDSVEVVAFKSGDEAQQGTVQVSPAPSTSGFRGDTNLPAVADTFVNQFVVFVTGALKGRSSIVQTYNATRDFTVAPAFKAAPSSGDKFIIIGRN